MALQAFPDADTPLIGHLYIFVAFDWGEELDLHRASRLAPGAVVDLLRRPRTPTSINFKPSPLCFRLPPESCVLPGLDGFVVEDAEATVFDFAAASVALRASFQMSLAELTPVAGRLAEASIAAEIVRVAREAVEPLHEKLLPALRRPHWDLALNEEYFVFQFPLEGPLTPELLLGRLAGKLAGLTRLEDQPLSDTEIAEATRLHLRYGRHDLFVADWAAAALLDREEECDETLRTIEFANLQLLEYRHIDDRLDGSLSRAYQLAQRAAKSHFPLLGAQDKPLRAIGEWKVEATGLFERTSNVLKLIGDQYLARVYRQLAMRFHLRDWERNIRRKLEVIEGVYETVSDRRVTFRMEFLEIVVILLIMLEVVLALVHH